MVNGHQTRRNCTSNKFMKLFRNESSYKSDEVALLLVGLNEMEITSKCLEKAAESERRGIEAIAKWAKRSRNSAIDDVMEKTNQLFKLYSEKQEQFARDHDHFLRELRKIADIEQRVRDYEKLLEKREARVSSIRKQITRSSFFWKKSTAEMAALRRVEDEATLEVGKARYKLMATQQENEVIKMFLFRRGMMGLADSYRLLNEHSRDIFDALREITELVPALSTQNINEVVYEGAPISRERLAEVRRSLETSSIQLNYNPPAVATWRRAPRDRRSMPGHLPNHLPGTPPPPYSALGPRSQNPAFPASSFSDSQLRQLSQGVRTPVSRQFMSSSRIASAPEATPLSMSGTSNVHALYPDLSSLLAEMGHPRN